MSDTRERIIQTTADLLQRQGYCATGLNQIIRESQSPKGSLYHYFPGGKEELAAAAIRESGEKFAGLLQEAIDEAGSVARGIPRFIRIYAGLFAESQFEKGCPIATVTLETAAQNEALQTATREIFQSWCQTIIDHLVTEGWQKTKARQMAIFIMSSFNGALTMSRAGQTIEPLEIAATQIEHLLNQ